MREKTRTMRLAELELGCPIEEYVQRRAEAGDSIPVMARQIGVTPECLRGWIRQWGGRFRLEFAPGVCVESAP